MFLYSVSDSLMYGTHNSATIMRTPQSVLASSSSIQNCLSDVEALSVRGGCSKEGYPNWG